MHTRGRLRRLLITCCCLTLLGGSTDSIPEPALGPPTLSRPAHSSEQIYTSAVPAKQPASARAYGGAIRLAHSPALSARLLDPPATPTPQAVNQTINTIYYDISGATANDLAIQINTRGPAVGDIHYAANTAWRFTWSYHYQPNPESCIITSAQVDVSIDYTYPRWIDASSASPNLGERWNRFMAALIQHEEGHGSRAIATGDELLNTLLTLPAAESCAALSQQATASTAAILAHNDQAQQAYDDETRHGESQGAIW